MYPIRSLFQSVFIIILSAFIACSGSKSLTKTSEINMLFDGNRYSCEESESGYCNRISYSTDVRNAVWEFWDGKIAGFETKPSNLYRIKVIKTEKIDKKTQQSQDIEFKLVEVLKKEPYSREGKKNYDFIGKLREKGVEFYARGNEPGWMVDIYKDGRIEFSTMSDRKLNFESNLSNAKVEERAQMKTYTFQEPAANLVMIAENCEDNMSGEKFTHQVTMKVGGKTFQGCGMVVPDLRLNDIFVFESLTGMNGETIKMQFEDKPYIEWNIDQMKIYGFGGCNEFGGNFEFQDEKIKVGPLMSSRKACPGLSEPKLMEFLSNQVLIYEYNELVLILEAKNGQKSQWRKVD